MVFAMVTYWLINLRPRAIAFSNFVAVLFLELLAAESLVALISSAFPIFVVALAVTEFANALWMAVSGFMVTPQQLNAFWKYTFYQIGYQRYALSVLFRNQMIGSVYQCGENCQCIYVTSLASQCMINGKEAIELLGFDTSNALSYVISTLFNKLRF